jgi:hypothetical protein
VPDLVIALTMPPIARPNSAAAPRLTTWNSAIESWLYLILAKVKDSSVFHRPSTSSDPSLPRAPANLRPIPWPAVRTSSATPGVSSAKSR